MANHLFGMHDWSPDWGKAIKNAGVTAWAVLTCELGDNPDDTSGQDFRQMADYGVTPLVRLNYSHSGKGTLPLSTRYLAFAERVANFVAASPGCRNWIIGNEPNYANIEAPWTPEGDMGERQPITPDQYAACFLLCRQAIQGLPGHEQDDVLLAAVAPWNNQTRYPGNELGDWVKYFNHMLTAIGPHNLEGICLHVYTHGPGTMLITDEARMESPFQDYRYNFRAYQDFLALVPISYRFLPVYITEADQVFPWRNQKSGWITRAYAEISQWNSVPGHQSIKALALYRWSTDDNWCIQTAPQAVAEFYEALENNYATTAPPALPPAAPPSFAPGDMVTTLYEVNLRATPGYLAKDESDVLRVLKIGAALAITGYFKLADNLIWWPVQSYDGTGWVAQATAAGEPLLTKSQLIAAYVVDKATLYGIDPVLALAVFQIESGEVFAPPPTRMTLRMELHLLYNFLPSAQRGLFEEYFTFNHNGQPWTGHFWRKTNADTWLALHNGQDNEYAAMQFACDLFGREPVLSSCSMGPAQILGCNSSTVGYNGAAVMFDAWQNNFAAQVDGFFSFVKGMNLINAIQNQDFETFARVYNGAGNTQTYAALLRQAVTNMRDKLHANTIYLPIAAR